MSLELPGAKLLPSATYSGNGDYNLGGLGPGSANLYYPSSGNVVISPDLEVTGDMIVDGGIYGPSGATYVGVRCPDGAVGASSNTPLPTPQGIRMTDAGDIPSVITAVTSPPRPGDGATKFAVGMNNGLVVGESVFLANGVGGDSVVIGSTIGNSVMSIPAQDGGGSITYPFIVPGPFANPPANIQRYTLNGNKGWFLLPACANLGDGTIVVISPDPRMGGNGIGRILPLMVPQLGSVPALSLTLGGGYGGPSDFTFINSRVPGTTWLVGVEYM